MKKKEVKEPPNVTKELSHVMLESHNVRMKPSNVRKKSKGTTNSEKKLTHVMLKLYNVRMKPLNVRKCKGTTKCEKRTVICDVGVAQCEDGIVKYEKKK